MISTMKARATSRVVTLSLEMPKPMLRFTAKAREAVEADVIPEVITMKHTMNVKKWTPNALCVYSAAPAACGYLVTSSK